jgi:hypothetical protein
MRARKCQPFLFVAFLMVACTGSQPEVRTADSAIRSTAETLKSNVDTMIREGDSAIHAIGDTLKSNIKALADSARKAIKK